MGLGKYGAFGVNSFVQQKTWDNSIDANDEATMSSSSSSSSSSFDDSTNSGGSSSSLDLVEDASSSNSSLASSPGPLYELSDLMAHLPIKRGLSKHYQGKSQSFTSLSNVNCLEDLVKKESSYSKRMKSCKSSGKLDKSYAPRTCSKIISKKVSRAGSFLSSLGKRSISPSNYSPRSPFSLGKNF